MKVYVDILFFINFFCDYLILYSVCIILKRKFNYKKIFIASLFGSISMIVLFININSILLFIIKILLGSIMIIISFGYKNIKYFLNNLLYFLLNSIMLGGFIYLLNLKFNNVIISSLFYNTTLLGVLTPIIIYIYSKSLINLKNNYSLKYKLDIYINNKIIRLIGYYDTGSLLKDPYKRRPIIIVNESIFKSINTNYIYTPVETINGSYLMKCFKPDNIYIRGLGIVNNVLIGLSKEIIKIDGVDCLINKSILEGIYENN